VLASQFPSLSLRYGFAHDCNQTIPSDDRLAGRPPKGVYRDKERTKLQNNNSIPADRHKLTILLRSFLDGLADEEVLYYPTPGNGGDCVIQVGTYQALNRAGIRFRPINLDYDVTGRTVMLGGGANLVPLYCELRHALLDGKILQRCGRLIILPHTIRGNEDLLKLMDDRVTIFCRDPESYLHVERYAVTKNVYLDHDMALHLDVEQFYDEAKPYTDVPGLFERLLAKEGHSFAADDISTTRRFFRTDGEKLPGPLDENNLDISITFQLGTWPENSYKAVWCFFEAIRRSGLVLTDRLHVGIAASLLGKKCQFFDNNYGKNRTIYLHSVRKYATPALLEFVIPQVA
jgi:exopolysaccharide biosynthesis predicted pyruvyltransferase EpsI